ncbi:pyridoxal phosphate-dependent transferase [Roridomyces roridus]|uniref:Pyridoxal phosphate-dependent transferase n=1 Tax=Roridomyces roridus TaxID=1738132 RepID=A0AAD7C4N5_9AGAR|nr:pyridoxal phosphate-dependent transferase [Roridomyces roridus]
MSGEPIDVSHHLSALARARPVSPLKGLFKYWGKPGLLNLAGGLPSAAYFPFADLSANALQADSFPIKPTQESSFSWFWKLLWWGQGEDALQYGMAAGLPQLQKIIKEFSAKVYQPAYDNYAVLLHAGNTDAWSKVVTTLCNPGEGVLVSKWTYPSAMATMQPHNIRPIPVDTDAQGMRSDSLRAILTEWDEAARGMPRPHVIYAVPIGENPTGTTAGIPRRKEIYQICVEFGTDFRSSRTILCEDDPYWALQEGEYVPKAERKDNPLFAADEESRFIASLQPSYLKFDYQGRVIRMDTFSKTIAPGARLGWYTCHPTFAERLERASETSTQAPCGFGQSLITAVLIQWKYEGFIRWLMGLRLQYTLRRDCLVDNLAEEFHLTSAPGTGIWEGAECFTGYAKPRRSVNGYFNEKLPVKVHFEHHPAFAAKRMTAADLEMKLLEELAEAGVLFVPGAYFWATGDYADPTAGHFRISFSDASVRLIDFLH